MNGWDSDYVSDIAYVPGYYSQQSPAHLVTAARLVGIACDMPEPDEPVHFLELGCGLGFTSLILAASNPAWRVTAVDFNPAHIATARAFARGAGIENVAFIEADLATLAEERAGEALAEADFVSVHGLWSWVSAEVQAGIVRLLRAKVRAGGIVHLSYNALPAWQGALGMQRAIRAGGLQQGGASDRQAAAGLTLVRDLHAAGARHLAGSKPVESILERLAQMPREYLAHEYMNGNWAPCFHADVARALSDAKLEWVASANVLENFPELTLTPQQREIHDKFADPLTRELVKDLCLNRMFRHDIFMRGASRLTGQDRIAILNDITLALTVEPADFSYEFDAPIGKATLSREIYEPLVETLAQGPRRLGELMSLPALATKRDSPAEVLGILVGSDQAIPVARPGAKQSQSARDLNALLADAFGRMEKRGITLALASTALGAGLTANVFELFMHGRINAGDSKAALDDWTNRLGARLAEEDRGKLREHLALIFARRVPVFRRMGLVGN